MPESESLLNQFSDKLGKKNKQPKYVSNPRGPNGRFMSLMSDKAKKKVEDHKNFWDPQMIMTFLRKTDKELSQLIDRHDFEIEKIDTNKKKDDRFKQISNEIAGDQLTLIGEEIPLLEMIRNLTQEQSSTSKDIQKYTRINSEILNKLLNVAIRRGSNSKALVPYSYEGEIIPPRSLTHGGGHGAGGGSGSGFGSKALEAGEAGLAGYGAYRALKGLRSYNASRPVSGLNFNKALPAPATAAETFEKGVVGGLKAPNVAKGLSGAAGTSGSTIGRILKGLPGKALGVLGTIAGTVIPGASFGFGDEKANEGETEEIDRERKSLAAGNHLTPVPAPENGLDKLPVFGKTPRETSHGYNPGSRYVGHSTLDNTPGNLSRDNLGTDPNGGGLSGSNRAVQVPQGTGAPAGTSGGGAPTNTNVSASNIPPEGKALLDTIATGESHGDYSIRQGGGHITDFSQHPGSIGPGGVSSAAGKYQFIKGTWNDVSSKLGLKDFSPESQDKAAWYLAQSDYKHRTGGRDLTTDLKSTDPKMKLQIAQVLNKTWTSLPGGGDATQQGGRKSDEFLKNYAANEGKYKKLEDTKLAQQVPQKGSMDKHDDDVPTKVAQGSTDKHDDATSTDTQTIASDKSIQTAQNQMMPGEPEPPSAPQQIQTGSMDKHDDLAPIQMAQNPLVRHATAPMVPQQPQTGAQLQQSTEQVNTAKENKQSAPTVIQQPQSPPIASRGGEKEKKGGGIDNVRDDSPTFIRALLSDYKVA